MSERDSRPAVASNPEGTLPAVSLDDERYGALRLASLGGFEVEGAHWETAAHYLVAARFDDVEARERLRGEWHADPTRSLARMRALADTLDAPTFHDWPTRELEVLRRVVTLAVESNLRTRALLLSTGNAPILGGDDPRLGAVLEEVRATQTRVRRFPGPSGALVFDEYLFAFDARHGLTAWDAVTGERLLHTPGFRPTGYHRSGRCFFAVDGDTLTLGRVVAA